MMRASGAARPAASRTRSLTSAAAIGCARERNSRTAMVSPALAAAACRATARNNGRISDIRTSRMSTSLASQRPAGLGEAGQLVAALGGAPGHLFLGDGSETRAERSLRGRVQRGREQHLQDEVVAGR